MLDRIRRRAVLVSASAALLVVLSAVLGAAAPASAAPTPSASPVAQVIGGPQLAAPGVVVNYPSSSVPRLPNIQASALISAMPWPNDPAAWVRAIAASLAEMVSSAANRSEIL